MNFRTCFLIPILSIVTVFVLHAQTNTPQGRVLSISGKTIIAQFDDIQVSVGGEVEITRDKKNH